MMFSVSTFMYQCNISVLCCMIYFIYGSYAIHDIPIKLNGQPTGVLLCRFEIMDSSVTVIFCSTFIKLCCQSWSTIRTVTMTEAVKLDLTPPNNQITVRLVMFVETRHGSTLRPRQHWYNYSQTALCVSTILITLHS